MRFDRTIEALSAPSPHEGEAARSDRPYADAVSDLIAIGSELAKRSDDRSLVADWHSGVRVVRETAPTEPRSISEEQLERDAKLVRERVLPEIEGSDEGWALDRFLAAYEQAEARADTWKGIAESHRDENLRLEAERDTAQASEARMREAVEAWDAIGNEVRDSLDLGLGAMRDREGNEDPYPTEGFTRKLDQALRMARQAHRTSSAALASTPDPEERVSYAVVGERGPEFAIPEPSCDTLALEALRGDLLAILAEAKGDHRVSVRQVLKKLNDVRPPSDPTPEPEEGRG